MEAKPVVQHRLTEEAYRALERQVPPLHVGNDTTPQQCGFQLGCQHVLKLVRTGYVIGA